VSREADVVKRVEVRIGREEVERLVAALARAKATSKDQRSPSLAVLADVAAGKVAGPAVAQDQDWTDWSDNDRVTVSWAEES
jgi:hypothetical protein